MNRPRPSHPAARSTMLAATLAMLAACGSPPQTPQPAEASPAETPAPDPAPTAPPTPAPAPIPVPAPPTVPASAEVERDCLLVVDGTVHVQGRCWVYPMGDGGLTLNTWSKGKPDRSHFAVVGVTRPGVADASWNKDPDDTHAWDPLGEVTLQDGCWTNARVRICARALPPLHGEGG